MIITQENLIAQIAGREEISPVTVRRIFKSAEDIIFNHLSSTTSSEHTVIKVLDGLSLECSLLPERKIHTMIPSSAKKDSGQSPKSPGTTTEN